MTKTKKVVLKFGGKCNLTCKHCHCLRTNYEFNPDIIDWINDRETEDLHMCGGEPFLYFDMMKKIIPQLTTIKRFHTTTNGTVLNDEMVDFCNKYGVIVAVSYDGPDSQRTPCLPNYDAVGKIKVNGVSQVFYHGNTDMDKIIFETRKLGKAHGMLAGECVTNIPAFVHQTKDNPNSDTTKEDVDSYIKQYAKHLELGLMNYNPDGSIFSLGAAHAFIRHFINHKPYEVGCRCCNPRNITVTLDGRFLLCPYGDTYVGDIYKGVDWDLVESYIPDKCKTCPFKLLCGPSCIANVTDNECYIFRVLYRHYKKLLKKYNIDETALLNRPEWSEE